MSERKETIVIAGATGYLGKYLVEAASRAGYRVRALVRPGSKGTKWLQEPDEIFHGEATEAASISGLCNGAVAVISSLGITRQKDGLKYRDVDYQANVNIMREGLRAGIRHMTYVSVFNGDQQRSSRLVDAKEAFVDELQSTALPSLIVRPTGYFSDMGDFLQMARGGRVFYFGDGSLRINPIHGADLAEAILERLGAPAMADPGQSTGEFNIGGPETFSLRELGQLALESAGKPRGKCIGLPDGIRRGILGAIRLFGLERSTGALEFFLTAMGQDAAAPEYGSQKLGDFFRREHEISQ